MYTIVNLLTVTNTVPAVLKKIWSIYCDKELLFLPVLFHGVNCI